MKFYRLGKKENPVIFLLPGTCCHWKANFGGVIPLLTDVFQVVCVSYDGFDETEQTEFPDMLTETKRLESYIQKKFGGRICAAYGCSLGGSFVGLLIQRRKIQIEHGILGSSDLDQAGALKAGLEAALISGILARMFRKGTLPGFMKKRLEKKPPKEQEYYQKMLEMFGVGSTRMSFVTVRSIRRQFYSDLVTPLETDISVPGTTIHCFYAAKMGEEYLQRYQKHFRQPDIRRQELQHEELLVSYPEKWAEEVKSCCGLLHL
ncbi:hypothetical protein BRYFOR_07858 [Marvinbryantia formatexigens DSM 14469]|uniref:2-hydroxy-6-oxo-6-phenylhexa-2,4-dienoate hydrolase n=1 Tax=Marvinbryantia formatexigens DSM 14469 TaxID=478749 RepID=C6LGU8_9FIRM|nr:alpha/beta hydrolase [Marvinbryantia formatexigens]EET60298.1 hypothetical protein BRYFOR_07858 [Marvinbryantia formatexigens DSM 14469]UWO24313.1 alpha/beta hydrolase [Marvinbryantia formatexigens DSM 14469]SDF54609.1 hypothetical protein SAMN05660368_00890 [Marvinbryantia formatexigens]